MFSTANFFRDKITLGKGAKYTANFFVNQMTCALSYMTDLILYTHKTTRMLS